MDINEGKPISALMVLDRKFEEKYLAQPMKTVFSEYKPTKNWIK
jgi:hypothetical protein